MAIQGVVLDSATRAPIAGAAVFVDNAVLSERPASLALLDLSRPPWMHAAHPDEVQIGDVRRQRGTLTSGDGTFSFVAPSRHRFLIAFSTKHEPRIVPVAADGNRVVVWLDRGSRLEGTVVSAQGRALPGVRMYCRPDRAHEEGVFGRSFVTDGSGAFVLDGLTPALYELKGVMRGDRERSVRVRVLPDATARASLDLGLAVEVRVTAHSVIDLAPKKVKLYWRQAESEPIPWSAALGDPVAAGATPRDVAAFSPLTQLFPVEDMAVPPALELHALGYKVLERRLTTAELALGYIEWDAALEPAADAARLALVIRGPDGLQLPANAHEIRVLIRDRPDSNLHVHSRLENELEFPLLIPGRYLIGVQVAGKGEGEVDLDIAAGDSRRMDVNLTSP